MKEHDRVIFFHFAKVQIRPWNLSDSDFVMDGSQPLDPRKTIFVGGVPRPLRAGNICTSGHGGFLHVKQQIWMCSSNLMW